MIYSRINNSRKTAVTNIGLGRLDISIAAMQETWLAAVGMLQEKDYTFFWQGRAPEEPCLHGVGFSKVNILNVYAPMLCSPQEMKNQFYKDLDATMWKIPESEHIILLGDFNARVI